MNLRLRLSLSLTGVAALAALPTLLLFGWLFRLELVNRAEGDGLRIANVLGRSLAALQEIPNTFEQKVSDQMLVTAATIAHLVASGQTVGESPERLQQRLNDILRTTTLDEIWVTDERGCTVFRPPGTPAVCVGAPPAPADGRRPLSAAPSNPAIAQSLLQNFLPLLRGQKSSIILPSQKRTTDDSQFKYVGIGGVDRPRMVVVGQSLPLVQSLRRSLGPGQMVDQLVEEADVLGIWAIDAQGQAIAGRAQPGSDLNDLPNPDQLSLLRQGLAAQQVGSTAGLRRMSVVVPLFDREQTLQGSVLIVLSLDRLQSALGWQLALLIAVTLIALLVALGVSFLLAQRIVWPIVALTEASQAIARGDWTRPLPTQRSDEVGLLARSFGRMVEQLQHYLETLETRVQERTTALASANEEISLLNERLQQENQRMEGELSVVRRLHGLILPKENDLAGYADLDIAAYMEPADQVGGDYYDVWQHDGWVEIGIGDVTGHGLESGMVMLMVQAGVRTLGGIGATDPVKTVNALNRLVYDNTRRMRSYKNMTLALLSYQDGKVRLCGQHEEAIALRLDGRIERFDTFDLGFPLGLEADISPFVAALEFSLEPGETIVLYTDGVTEAASPANALYGPDRLGEVLLAHRDRPAAELCQAVIDDLYAHMNSAALADDLTLLVIKRRPAVS